MLRRVSSVLIGTALVCVMATSLVAEVQHEYFGIAAVVLVCFHVIAERKRLAALVLGKKNAHAALSLLLLVALVALVVGIGWSSLVLSKHAFGFLPAFPGAVLARKVHLSCTYWLFMVAFAHAGLDIRVPRKKPSVPIAVVGVAAAAAVVAFGVWSFVDLNLVGYLSLSIDFAFADITKTIPFLALQWAAIGLGVMAVVFALRCAMRPLTRKKHDN
ncbi:MAG: hypothetical protein Q4E12_05640 [Coriobacteriia bacterium]|nr:hypothetical protein [Coriobacteriia bacterium]